MSEPPAFASQSYARWRATPLGAVNERLEMQLVFDLAGPLDGRTLLDAARGFCQVDLLHAQVGIVHRHRAVHHTKGAAMRPA